MTFCSTRGEVTGLTFEDVLFNTYASDGGLFMPENIPKLDLKTLVDWSSLSYVELCKVVSRLFIPESEIPTVELNGLITKAFNSGFDHEKIIPIVKVRDFYVAELWHGKTMAFKDLALSCVAQFMEYFNEKRKRHITVIVSTSGDTGSAAIESVRMSNWIDIIVMFPKGYCSKVQELQMTTVLDDNVHVFCGEGTSDDLDIPLKNCLTNKNLVKEHGLCSINSVNWARIMIQTVHYFYTYFQASDNIHDEVEIVVPTGAAGNITAGVIAFLMGLPIRLVAATNVNDVFHRALSCGDFSLTEVVPTIAPAMDIQAPYNMERIIYLFSGAEQCANLLRSYEKHGRMEIPLCIREKIANILCSMSVCHNEIVDMMKKSWFEWHYLLDPHTAIALSVACHKYSHCTTLQKHPYVVLSTAHADKFPETMSSLGIEHKPCRRIQCLWEKPTKYKEMRRGDNWDKILMDTILSITETNKC